MSTSIEFLTTGHGGRRRYRRRSDEEKALVVAQTLEAGLSDAAAPGPSPREAASGLLGRRGGGGPRRSSPNGGSLDQDRQPARRHRTPTLADQADALRRLRRRALDRLNTLGQAIFHEMFVENARPDWPVVKIDEVVSNARTGPFGSQLLSSELVDGGIPVLGIDNVVSNEFAWGKPRFITPEKYQTLARYTVAPGDVLITIMGTCGRCIVVPQGMPTAINTKHICCLTPQSDRVDSEYLRAAFLMHPAVLKQLGVEAKGAVMPGLNMGIIKAIKLPLPGMQMQREFSARMAAARDQSIVARRYVNELEGLFASLQHRAFRGEL